MVMKTILILLITLSSVVFAAEAKGDADKKARTQKQLEKQMQKEKKFKKEQTFYQSKNYDLKGAEVNQESLDSVPELEPEYDFDMDSVYD